MPPLPAVPNVLKVQLLGQSGEATPINWANVLHFQYSGAAPSSATCAAIAGHISFEWNAFMAPECVNNVTLQEVAVTDLTSDIAGAGADHTVQTGSRGDDEIPANVAYLVTYPISRRYRGGHPRSYLMVLGNADFLDAAHWSSAATAEVATHWGEFLSGIVGYSTAGCTISNMVNVSYYNGTDPVTKKPILRPSPVVDSISVADLIGHQQMASQRRRIGRHRR